MTAIKDINYETGLLGLSRIKTLLNELTPLSLSELPSDNIDDFVTFLLFELSDNMQAVNVFCKRITKLKKDFTGYSFDELKAVCLGFFTPISESVLSYVKILQKGLLTQKVSDLELLLSSPKGKEYLEEAMKMQEK